MVSHSVLVLLSDAPTFDPSANPYRYYGVPFGTGAYGNIEYHYVGNVPVGGYIPTQLTVQFGLSYRYASPATIYTSYGLPRFISCDIYVKDGGGGVIYHYTTTTSGYPTHYTYPGETVVVAGGSPSTIPIPSPVVAASVQIDIVAFMPRADAGAGIDIEQFSTVDVALYSPYAPVAAKLYRCAAYPTSPVWSDVTPAASYAP